jgi:glucuronoxylan 4-O-methyltransferase
VGNDTSLWLQINKNGRTVFLENVQSWIDKILQKKGISAEVYKVVYTTRISQWKELLGHPEKLKIDLPEIVTDTAWDVIVVDSPVGYPMEDTGSSSVAIPGRMQSIYMASLLASKGCYVFIHDTERIIERTYCERYCNNLVFELKVGGLLNKIGLRCYKM